MLRSFALYCMVVLGTFGFAQHKGYAFSSLFGHHYHGTQQDKNHGGYYGSGGYSGGSSGYYHK